MTGLDFLDNKKKTDREETLVIVFRKMSSPFFSCFLFSVGLLLFYFLAIFIFSRRAALVEYGRGVPVLRSLELDFGKIAITRSLRQGLSLRFSRKDLTLG